MAVYAAIAGERNDDFMKLREYIYLLQQNYAFLLAVCMFLEYDLPGSEHCIFLSPTASHGFILVFVCLVHVSYFWN